MQHLVESYIVFHSFVYEKAIMFMKAKSSHCEGTVCDHFTILKEKKKPKKSCRLNPVFLYPQLNIDDHAYMFC